MDNQLKISDTSFTGVRSSGAGDGSSGGVRNISSDKDIPEKTLRSKLTRGASIVLFPVKVIATPFLMCIGAVGGAIVGFGYGLVAAAGVVCNVIQPAESEEDLNLKKAIPAAILALPLGVVFGAACAILSTFMLSVNSFQLIWSDRGFKPMRETEKRAVELLGNYGIFNIKTRNAVGTTGGVL